ncbi:hypothetical protein ACFFQF_10995 [Haladaptatus pallidirubidus]|uniref:Transposase n=1 Tax=Haladaptatus pallidirubidus TaxID=1008152 RepID=A0AAV3UEE7_9EURY|nr:hypothetical protein [Haladaptatus pallidirubidus]
MFLADEFADSVLHNRTILIAAKKSKKRVKSDASAGGFFGSRTVWNCPHCGAILGVSDNG